jgi:hypothetical protein
MPATSSIQFPINAQNFTIMYRFEDITANKLKTEDEVLYLTAFYSHSVRNMTTGQLDTVEYIHMENTLCKDTESVTNPNVQSLDLNNMYCFNYNQNGKSLSLGGDWSDTEMSVILVFLSSCKINPDSTVDISKCHPYEDISYKTTKMLQYLTFYIPELTIDPQNFHHPVHVKYKMKYYLLSSDINQSYEMYFTKAQLFADNGWIFEDIKIFSAVTLSSDNYYFSLTNKQNYESSPNQNLFQALYLQMILFGEYYHLYLHFIVVAVIVLFNSLIKVFLIIILNSKFFKFLFIYSRFF